MINENWYQTAIEDYGIKEILYEELSEEKEKIGSGGFGKIYKTKCNSLGTVAIKEITIDIEVDIKRFIKELKLHSQIKHERIILFHGISRDEHKGHYLVLEYAKQGNLREFITKRFKEGEFKWAERKRLAIQIAEGLRYLHNEKNIIHRDLHTKNILIDDGLRERPITGTPIEYKQIYVDCWELDPDSRPLVVEVLSRLESMSLEPVFEGDDEYPTYYPPSSPENTSGFNPSMASYIIPDGPTNPTTSSTNTDKLIRDIKNEVRPNNIIGIPECYHELMQKCLDPDSKKRPTTQDLLDELENFTTTSLKKQFDNVDQELRDQPLGTRPKQLKDNNVITKSSINVKESYAGEIRFRFTNKQLKQLQFYNVPEP
ncbi:unnamed protein product [Rhizophagus irregularis]|nr:unnamed protein product [Rhizophagus irregularis]